MTNLIADHTTLLAQGLLPDYFVELVVISPFDRQVSSIYYFSSLNPLKT